MAITKSPAEKSDAGSKAAQTRVPSPQADHRREGVVVGETESDDLQASMRTIMAMQLRTDTNMEEVRAEVDEAKRDREMIMQILTGMQEVQRRLVAALGLGGGDRCEEAAAKASNAAVADQLAGVGGGKPPAASAAGAAAAVSAAVDAVAGSGGEATATAATLGQAGTDRVDLVADGPRGGPGLLPTPTAEEIAALRGKAKMPGYDNVVQNPCFKPMGPSPMEGETGRGPRTGDGPDRASGAERAMVNRPGPESRTGPGWVDGGRTEPGMTEAGRTGAGWTDNGRTRAGWTTNGRTGVGRFASEPHRFGLTPDGRPVAEWRAQLEGSSAYGPPLAAAGDPGGQLGGYEDYPGGNGPGWSAGDDARGPRGYYRGYPSAGRYGSYDRYDDEYGLVFRAKPPTIEFPKFNG
ncbi:unnamed protein product [Linum trigynum]|uniref:Uncharacterized protein n=1 Tax=Linum trigynum TaxID=586398 RepID=A0AAV2CAC6_9ROSI